MQASDGVSLDELEVDFGSCTTPAPRCTEGASRAKLPRYRGTYLPASHPGATATMVGRASHFLISGTRAARQLLPPTFSDPTVDPQRSFDRTPIGSDFAWIGTARHTRESHKTDNHPAQDSPQLSTPARPALLAVQQQQQNYLPSKYPLLFYL